MLVLLLIGVAVMVMSLGATRGGRVTGGAVFVYHRERADGVHPQLQQLLDAWAREGTHNVVVADYPGPGGLRTDEAEQQELHADGLSGAASLIDTPHGRGAALDVHPEGFDPHRGFGSQADAELRLRAFGEFAERYGFVWGGRWSKPDMPHVELPNWRALPFPPPQYTGGEA